MSRMSASPSDPSHLYLSAVPQQCCITNYPTIQWISQVCEVTMPGWASTCFRLQIRLVPCGLFHTWPSGAQVCNAFSDTNTATLMPWFSCATIHDLSTEIVTYIPSCYVYSWVSVGDTVASPECSKAFLDRSSGFGSKDTARPNDPEGRKAME